MWYVYILKSTINNSTYKGLTSNLEERLHRHFTGRVRSSKKMLPLQLIHVEICSSRYEARKLEKFFKSGLGREIIKEIIS